MANRTLKRSHSRDEYFSCLIVQVCDLLPTSHYVVQIFANPHLQYCLYVNHGHREFDLIDREEVHEAMQLPRSRLLPSLNIILGKIVRAHGQQTSASMVG